MNTIRLYELPKKCRREYEAFFGTHSEFDFSSVAVRDESDPEDWTVRFIQTDYLARVLGKPDIYLIFVGSA